MFTDCSGSCRDCCINYSGGWLDKTITLEIRKINMKTIKYYIDKLFDSQSKRQKAFIAERMREYAMNIDEFTIGETVVHTDGRKCVITSKTKNSIEVYLTRKTKDGVNCKQWYDMRMFNNIFKKI